MGHQTLKYLVLILICSINLFATDLQQLESKLGSISGKEKVNLIITLSEKYQLSNPQKSLNLSYEAYNLAKIVKDEALMFKSNIAIAKAKFQTGKTNEAFAEIESCLTYAKKTKNIDFEIDALIAKGEFLTKLNKNEEAKNLFSTSLYLTQKFKDNNKSIIALHKLGDVYETLNDLGNATECYLSSIKLNQNKIDSLKLIETYLKLCSFSLKIGNKKQALEFVNLAKPYLNKEMENEKGIINNYLSSIYFPEDKNLTFYYLNEALKYRNKFKDQKDFAEILGNIGEFYRFRRGDNDYKFAEKYYNDALDIYKTFKDKRGIAIVYLYFASVNIQKQAHTKVIKYLDSANFYVSQLDNLGLKIELAEKYTNYYDGIKDYKKALESVRKHILLLDTLAFVAKNQRFNSIYTQFKDDEAKQQIELFKKNQAIKDLELAQQKTQIALLIVAAALLLVVIGVFLMNSKAKKKKELEVLAHNEQLTKLTNELKHKNKDLEILKADLEDSLQLQTEINETNKKLVTIIAHEYKTPLNYIQNALDLFAKTARKENFLNAETHIDNTIGMISKITNLLDQSIKISKSSSAKLNVEIEEIQINKYFNELIFDYFAEIDTQKHQFNLNLLQDEANMFITPSVLDLIFHNLILNALKYSPAYSQVDIILNKKENNLLVSIKDQGIGIPLAEQSNLFVQNHRFSNVENIKGSGVGLYLAKQILNEIKGNIEIISDTNHGTLINLIVPMDTRA